MNMENTTSLDDLIPENISYQLSGSRGGLSNTGFPSAMDTKITKGEFVVPTYEHLDVHPNPFLGKQTEEMGFPEMSSYKNQPQYQLPSRDIPQSQAGYLHDIQAQPNQIPKVPKMTSDFVREHNELTEPVLRNRKQKKHRRRVLDDFISEFQYPLLVAVLFFISQIPAVQDLFIYFLSKYLPFLIFSDGNINNGGILFKSLIFGLVYYGVIKTASVLGEEVE
jgi:hypothetical protein